MLFLVSMTPCRIGSELGWIQSVALFVAPDGLGTPIDTSLSRFIFNNAKSLTDWRDTRLQWDEDNGVLVFAISNHQNIQLYVNSSKDISKFELTQTFDTGYTLGIECTDFHPIIDSVTGEKYWLMVASKQTPGKGIENPRQTIAWYLGKWNGARFSSLNTGIFEYGHDFYAQSVSEPRQEGNPERLIMRGYIGNWGYIPYVASPQKGYVGGCWEDREIRVENGVAMVRPLIDATKVPARSLAPAKTVPTWVKAKLSAARENSLYALTWDSGEKVLLDISSVIRFDTSQSGVVILPGKVFAPMPVSSGADSENVDIDIFLNGSCLSFYINGKQACFQIFPRGRFTGLTHLKGSKRISHTKYYDVSPLFA